MPRPVAFSAKQKRAQLLDKRAVKRGELDPADVRVSTNMTVADSGPSGGSRYARTGFSMSRTSRKAPKSKTAQTDTEMHTTRLVSTFVALTPEYVQETRDEAFEVVLERPIKEDIKVFPIDVLYRDRTMDLDGTVERLTCPSRPLFGDEMSKEQVEKNEAEYFAKWLERTTRVSRCWARFPTTDRREMATVPSVSSTRALRRHSPTWFETSLEVWRQLWRVTETSHVLLVLLDARCPPVHLPPSLRSYLQNLRPRKEVILILTKSDLVDPAALQCWKGWLERYWQEGLDEQCLTKGEQANGKTRAEESPAEGAGVQIVSVTSYNTGLLHADKARQQPGLPSSALSKILEALTKAHERLSPIMKKSQRPVRSDIDWDLLGQGPATPPIDSEDVEALRIGKHGAVRPTTSPVMDIQPLTVGLIGQPNVGKSSLLNVLLGETRMKASKTPGKTKHFQTMFWGWKRHVKVVDCPGLVCPSLVGLELQALCGVLPISQIPSLPACIATAAQLMPLETICRIPKPETIYREEAYRRNSQASVGRDVLDREVKWTPAMIMEGRAIDRGYVTAKTGRPDINRAANNMMRQLAEGKIRWCFYPPISDTVSLRANTLDAASSISADRSRTRDLGRGIWLGDNNRPRPSDATAEPHTARPAMLSSGSESESSCSTSSTLGFDSRTAESKLDNDGDENEHYDDDDDRSTASAKYLEGGFFAVLGPGAADDGEDEDENDAPYL